MLPHTYQDWLLSALTELDTRMCESQFDTQEVNERNKDFKPEKKSAIRELVHSADIKDEILKQLEKFFAEHCELHTVACWFFESVQMELPTNFRQNSNFFSVSI